MKQLRNLSENQVIFKSTAHPKVLLHCTTGNVVMFNVHFNMLNIDFFMIRICTHIKETSHAMIERL